jgi:hypothetical protein
MSSVEYYKFFILKHGSVFKTDDATDIRNYGYHTFMIVMIFKIYFMAFTINMCDMCYETNTCNTILL